MRMITNLSYGLIQLKTINLLHSTAWDGYVAAITMMACHESRESGEKVMIEIDEQPALYTK